MKACMRLMAVVCGLSISATAVADETPERGFGLLTTPIEQPDMLAPAGIHPHIYARGAVAMVLPLDVDVETRTGGSTPSGEDPELNSKIGFGWNAAVGFRLGPGARPDEPGIGYRFEAEFAQRFYDTDSLQDNDTTLQDLDGNIEVTSIMGNVIFDVSAGQYRGYLGFGVGMAMVDVEIEGRSDDDTNGAFQIPMGMEVRVTENVWIDVGTRFFFVPGLDVDTDLNELSVLTADVQIGVLIEF